MTDVDITIEVNGTVRRSSVPPRLTLADFLRVNCGLTGTHVVASTASVARARS